MVRGFLAMLEKLLSFLKEVVVMSGYFSSGGTYTNDTFKEIPNETNSEY